MIRDPAAFAAHLRAGGAPEPVEGLAARVLRGRRPEDFQTLSLDPERRVVVLMGDDGLGRMLGVSGRERLLRIGYPDAYVDQLLDDGFEFRLAVFTRESYMLPATWENLPAVTRALMPEAADRLEACLARVRAVPFAELQAEAPWSMAEVYRAGRGDPRFMDAARFAASPGETWQARAFLFHELHLNELYTGDGWAQLEGGGPSLREYLCAVRPLAELPDCELVELPVTRG